MNCRKSLIWGTLLIMAAGAAMHFTFEWLGEWRPLGLIFPVNESAFEHLKLVFYPMVVYWLIAAPRKGEKKLWGPLALGVFVSLFLTTAIFYVFKGGFGIESLAIDIGEQAVSVLIGQWIICSLLDNGKKRSKAGGFLGGLFLIAFAAVVMLLTFKTPRLPIFQDPPSGGYGIDKQI